MWIFIQHDDDYNDLKNVFLKRIFKTCLTKGKINRIEINLDYIWGYQQEFIYSYEYLYIKKIKKRRTLF